MLKRLIEVALPLKEVSEQSAREKSIRHGHISTLHIWWARRPLAACRAVTFASLIPDPDDPECPEQFRQLVRDVLGDSQFRPSRPEPSPGAAAPADVQPVEDTPRNRCLEFIKHLVRWENSNDPDYVEPARKLIQAAHKILHPDSTDDAPKVLDPFAGGGAIPLEALRLGCEAHAIDINPVAHLIQLCTLVYPQKFGRPLPTDAPVPDYVREAADKGWLGGSSNKDDGLWGSDKYARAEAEYRRNPLAADVKYWGMWVLERAREELAEFYPPDPDGSVPVAYLWARTAKCPNPACGATIPLLRQRSVYKKEGREVALRMVLNREAKQCEFLPVEGADINFDTTAGTMQRGQAACPFCQTVAASKYLQEQGAEGKIGKQLIAIVTSRSGTAGKAFRAALADDYEVFKAASQALATRVHEEGDDILPRERLIAWSGVFNAPLFGMTEWADLFNDRQLLALSTFVRHVRSALTEIAKMDDREKGLAVASTLSLVIGRLADYCSTLCVWGMDFIAHTFGRQALPMIWDYAEGAPIHDTTGNWAGALEWVDRVIAALGGTGAPAIVKRGSATTTPYDAGTIDCVITDPPYYDAVPYSDLSDFFYVWQKRILGDLIPDNYRTPLTPKSQELVSHLGNNYPGKRKTAKDYEHGMAGAFADTHRVLTRDGFVAVMFAHKTTSAWETLITGLNRSGLLATASWPIHTERSGRLRAHGSAALASSVTILCRKRSTDAGEGVWDDVRRELREVAGERLDFFWNQGIRGADFFISAIGPALSVFGRYERVVRLSGEEVTVGQFLLEVRELVTDYATRRIFQQAKQDAPVAISASGQHVDSETQFYVMWRWSYGDAKVPADEAFKLAQALGFDTEMMWGKTGVLEKKGQDVTILPINKRMRVKDLGEPEADGTAGSLIDALHRLCGFRDKGDTAGAAEFLARSGHARSESLWLTAQAVSEILPDGDKEKQLMQGLLNQRDALLQAASEGAGLF